MYIGAACSLVFLADLQSAFPQKMCALRPGFVLTFTYGHILSLLKLATAPDTFCYGWPNPLPKLQSFWLCGLRRICGPETKACACVPLRCHRLLALSVQCIQESKKKKGGGRHSIVNYHGNAVLCLTTRTECLSGINTVNCMCTPPSSHLIQLCKMCFAGALHKNVWITGRLPSPPVKDVCSVGNTGQAYNIQHETAFLLSHHNDR